MPNKKAKGARAKTRHLMRNKVKVTVNKVLEEIPIGSKVDIKINSSVHSAMPPKRYHGYTGEVTAKRGAAYEVAAAKGNKAVLLIVNAAHLHISKGVTPKKEATIAEVEEAEEKVLA
ncbi:MAG: 50S ribosomal protein L21e [Candidatus Diapherotrites archaeon CG11_big_fil_rev_8_21_14_0_20_37_9]|nr:MAG: 50S ribosomal protein L21e [Candidatus Diapherotrites archaeon CG11_big_fil_rev_8_21_14_0_20_37_9]